MKALKAFIAIVILSLITSCMSTGGNYMDSNTAAGNNETGLQLDFELEMDNYTFSEVTILNVDEPLEIVIDPNISDDFYSPIEVNVENFLESKQELHILNYKDSIIKVLTDLFSKSFNVTYSDVVSDRGLQLIIKDVVLSEGGYDYSYEVALNFYGKTFETLSGTTSFADAGPIEYSFSSEAEWVEGEKSMLKPKAELGMIFLGVDIYSGIVESYNLEYINFWDFPFLTEDENINNILFKAGSSINYYKSGAIKLANVLEPVTINGAEYLDGTYYDDDYNEITGIQFHESGNLQFALLLEDVNIDGLVIAGNNIVSFYESGKVENATALENYTIDGIEYLGSADSAYPSAWFYESGNVMAGILANNTTLDKYTYEEYSYIEFSEKGQVIWGYLLDEVNINGYDFMSDISFYDSGKIEAGTLVRPTIIDGISVKSDEYEMVSFYENGKLRAGLLAEDTTIGKITMKADEYFYLDENGKFSEPPDYYYY